MPIFTEFIQPVMCIPMVLSGTAFSFAPQNVWQDENTMSVACEETKYFAAAEETQTVESSASQKAIYNAIAEDMLAFLRDDSDLDYADFEKKCLELVRYNEIHQFFSFVLQHKSDSDIYLFLNGIVETSVDIYSGDWYEPMLRFLSSDLSHRSVFLKNAAKILLDEYF